MLWVPGVAGQLVSLAPPAVGLRNPALGSSFQGALLCASCPEPADQPHALAFASRLLPAHIWDPRRPLVAEKGWGLGLLWDGDLEELPHRDN